MAKKRNEVFEYVEPIGMRVLVRKDEPKRQTKGGIALPDAAEIPTITGRIVTISAQIENDEDVPLSNMTKFCSIPKMRSLWTSSPTTNCLWSLSKMWLPCLGGK